MKQLINLFVKGMTIGVANVIPGVSGGTMALITGIFERLINAVKSLNIKALKLFFSGRFKEFAEYIDLRFLIAVFAGAFVGIILFARLLGFLFREYEIFVWAFFFGLILASVFFVGKQIEKHTPLTVSLFIAGACFAVALSFINPATENSNFIYLIICGIAGIVSMILPGLSGSFILILLGNYKLIMLDAVNNLNMSIILPFGLGMIIGLPTFAHVLSFFYKKYRDITISILAGFILGSLPILWPWKIPVYLTDSTGLKVLKSNGDPIVKYHERFFPEVIDNNVLIAISFVLIGILVIFGIEYISNKISTENNLVKHHSN